jgi:ABC-type multidrug transport system fused ATPase/permease subunit
VVQRFVVQAVQQMVNDLLMILGIGLMLFASDWKLAILALLPIPLVVICARIFASKFRRTFRAVRRKFANLSASLGETISGMRVVRSFGREDYEISGFDAKNADVFNARVTAVQARSKFGPVVGFLVGLGVLAVWLVGGRAVLFSQAGQRSGEAMLTLGTLLLFIRYMQQFYPPVRRLMNITEVFQESAAAAERVFNVMDMPSEVADHDKAEALADVHGEIRIENVSFGYDEGERVLKNIDLHVQPGEMIGLVGQTGSGKSTLVSLVCRFYDPTKGRILLDGVDLRDLQTVSLRETIGMVLQDPFLFAGTIKQNIAYGRQTASEAEIIQAAKAANAHEFIMNLPDGYDSEVGERGVMLSGGEKQRISIARAILKNPPVLILDEATSAVDTATEAMIQEAMDRLVHGRTTIAIAHRLSTLRNADRLVVMDEGEIIEMGTHEELIERDGTYARLCRIQAEFASTLDAE